MQTPKMGEFFKEAVVINYIKRFEKFRQNHRLSVIDPVKVMEVEMLLMLPTF